MKKGSDQAERELEEGSSSAPSFPYLANTSGQNR